MTLLEKAMREHPGLEADKLVTWMCPTDLGYEDLPDGCGKVGPVQEICRECWNRQADAAGDTSSALRAPSPRGEGKGEGGAEDGV